MSKFFKRSSEEEIMDDLNCSGEVVNQTLRELDTINELLGGNNVTINGLFQLLNTFEKQELIIADLGCGGGGMLKILSKKLAAKKLNASFVGIDANPNIITYALDHATTFNNIKFVSTDITSDEFQSLEFDIAIATLFFHHFSNDQLVSIFRKLYQQSRVGIVVNDLHRHWFAYHSIKILTKIFSKSAMVKFDAPLSVLRGFTKKELVDILHGAGISNYTLKWKWAFRWQIVIYKTK